MAEEAKAVETVEVAPQTKKSKPKKEATKPQW